MWVAINFEKHLFEIDNIADEFAKLLNKMQIDNKGLVILRHDDKTISAVGYAPEGVNE